MEIARWFTWIVKTWALTPLTGWSHWLVQDSRWRGTIWRFRISCSSYLCNAYALLICGNVWYEQINLRRNPQVCQHLKNIADASSRTNQFRTVIFSFHYKSVSLKSEIKTIGFDLQDPETPAFSVYSVEISNELSWLSQLISWCTSL